MSVAPQEMMFNLISGFWIARSIYLAAQLGIADCFDNAPKYRRAYGNSRLGRDGPLSGSGNSDG